jgi:CubicO group peptidase (beta-lactamase class C family)
MEKFNSTLLSRFAISSVRNFSKTFRNLSFAIGISALSLQTATAAVDDATLSAKAAAAKHGTYVFETWDQLVHKWKALGNAGMRLKDIEVFDNASGVRTYAGVWEPGTDKHALYGYDNWSSFVDKWNELSAQGYRLTDIESITKNNKTYYYGVYRAGSGKYALYNYNSWSSFTSKWAELNEQGLRLLDIDVSEDGNGNLRYVGVWGAGSGKYALFNYASWDDFAAKWDELGAQGYQLVDMDILRKSNGQYQHVGVWRAGSSNRALYRYTTWDAFKTKWAELAEKDYSLLDVEIVQRGTNGYYYVGSYGPAPSANATGPNLKTMAAYIERHMSPSTVGMSYAISQHGQLAVAGATGKAQRAPDANINMTSKTRSTVASVSKALTAPLLYKLLDANNLSVYSPIAPWLPSSWEKGLGFSNNSKGVTFYQLLTHTSGLKQAFNVLEAAGLEGQWENDWDGLQFVVANGTKPGSTRSYVNANFALMRILIPELWKAAGGPAGTVTKANVGQRYLAFMHQHVLDKENIDSITCAAQAGYSEAKSYNVADATIAGAANSATSDGCGGHAQLHYSAQELTRYAYSFRYNRDILSAANRSLMNGDLAGWNKSGAVEGGSYFEHGGDWYRGSGRETHTCLIELPHGVNASIIVNSSSDIHRCVVLRDAYNAALN